jgi:hypothetical protein
MDGNAPVDPAKIRQKLLETLEGSAATLVPWFYGNMPEYYFQTHGQEEQVKHLMTLLSGMVREEKQSIALHSPCGGRVTHISPGGDMDTLGWVLKHYRVFIPAGTTPSGWTPWSSARSPPAPRTARTCARSWKGPEPGRSISAAGT